MYNNLKKVLFNVCLCCMCYVLVKIKSAQTDKLQFLCERLSELYLGISIVDRESIEVVCSAYLKQSHRRDG